MDISRTAGMLPGSELSAAVQPAKNLFFELYQRYHWVVPLVGSLIALKVIGIEFLTAGISVSLVLINKLVLSYLSQQKTSREKACQLMHHILRTPGLSTHILSYLNLEDELNLFRTSKVVQSAFTGAQNERCLAYATLIARVPEKIPPRLLGKCLKVLLPLLENPTQKKEVMDLLMLCVHPDTPSGYREDRFEEYLDAFSILRDALLTFDPSEKQLKLLSSYLVDEYNKITPGIGYCILEQLIPCHAVVMVRFIKKYIQEKAEQYVKEEYALEDPSGVFFRSPPLSLEDVRKGIGVVEINIDPRIWFGCHPEKWSLIPPLIHQALWKRIVSIRNSTPFPCFVTLETRAEQNFSADFIRPLAQQILDANLYLQCKGITENGVTHSHLRLFGDFLDSDEIRALQPRLL